MCDCFHMVLPAWPGAPGSVSGRQLQAEDPDADTEDDRSVTEGPAEEIIRPRPQGSSPVYECVAEGAGFALREDTQSRPGASGRRRSWWKRDSGDSRTFARMSRSEEAAEVMLKTEVEAGASGYSVTGGGDQGIFVKQVLKGSSAAKLFSLREGDQLLSATVFFDHINYEDALKILQYSEPYKVQFHIKRKLPAAGAEDGASGTAQHAPKHPGTQDEDGAEGGPDTPVRTLERDGDQERLISKSRGGRGGRAQRERLSWPKFQAARSQRGPRRSHSSSEAHEEGPAPDGSPTSSDTEAQFLAEERERAAAAGSQRRRRFLNLRFKADTEDATGKERRAQKHPSRTAPERAGGARPDGDLGLGDKEVVAHDSKFKMPKFRMPSFCSSGAATGAAGDVTLPSIQADLEATDLSIDLPSADVDIKTGELGVKIPEGHLPEGELEGRSSGVGLKGHLPKVHMPSVKMPKVDFKGPQVDIKGPKVDLTGTKAEVSAPDVSVSVPSVEVDIQTPGSKLEGDIVLRDIEEATWDGKFKIPRFKVPSFGVSRPETDWGTSVDMPEATSTGEARLPSLEGEMQVPGGALHVPSAEIELPGREWEVAVPKGEVSLGELKGRAEGATFQGHLPKVQKPSMKMPNVDFKSPQVDIKGPKLDLKGPKGEVTVPDMEVSMPSVEVDIQATGRTLEGDITLGDKEVVTKDSKFKMPKFKMPSFGTSVPSKDWGSSVDMPVPKATGKMNLPSIPGETAVAKGSVHLSSADLQFPKGEMEAALPEGEVTLGEMKGKRERDRFKGDMPKVQMPSMKMPKVDFKGPQVDIKGPKVDLQGPKGEVTIPDMEVSLPSVEVDIQAPSAKLEGDIVLGDTEVTTKDSKFKMPKFKMPSFGMSGPDKAMDASVDVTLPKAEADVSLPSIQTDIKTTDLSIDLPSADIDIKTGELGVKIPEGHLPEGELEGRSFGVGFKGHLPKVHMPSMKMPKVDFKGPQVDIKGPKVDLQGPKGEVTVPDMEVSLPSVEVDIQAPSAKLEGDIVLGDTEVTTKDSKLKMPKFKMPSFGMSGPGKAMDASVDVSLPSIQTDIKTTDLSIDLPSADIDIKTGELGVKIPEGHLPEGELEGRSFGVGFKGHLPNVHMPSMKMPKVDFKGPQVDIKGPKVDLQGPKGEVTVPDMEVSLPSVEVDIQAPSAKLEGDIVLGDTEVTTKDSKFKMPKFKMPSFGMSGPGKAMETSVDVSLPSIQTDIKTSDLTIELPSADVDVKTGELGVKIPEGHLPEGELEGRSFGVGFKGHLPKVHMPSMKMPKVDFKGPQVDIKGPKVDLKGPEGEVTVPEGEVKLGDVKGKAEGPTFKGHMPKVQMPSMKMPKVDFKGPRVDIKGPKVDLKGPEGEVTVPEGEVKLGEVKGKAEGPTFKGQMPKVQMPSMKMPKVDFKSPQVDIKGPTVDLQGPKGEVTVPDMEVSLPSVEVDIQAPSAKLEGDIVLGDTEVTTKDSKFKMPKFKTPSFGMSGPGKAMETSVDVSLPSIQTDIKTSDLTIELPSAHMDVKTGELGVKIPEGHLPEGELEGRSSGVGFKGHLPKVHMPSMKMPKVDFKGPQVDIKGPKVDLKGPEGEVTVPEGEVKLGEVKGKAEGPTFKGDMPKVQMPSMKMPKVDFKGPQVDIKGPKVDLQGPKVEVTVPDIEVSLPSVEVDIQALSAKLEGDIVLGDTEVTTKDSKFKMPKFKMPSFGMSGPDKAMDASVDLTLPKAEADVSLPSIQTDIKTTDLSIDLPSADIDIKTGELGVKIPEGHLPEGELEGRSSGVGFKGHLPKVHMPSMKMPKVDFKGPRVDIKGPKVDLQGPKGEVTVPDMEVSLPSVEVDIQAPSAKLEGDIVLGDTEVTTKDSKFKMPKFKMPSFGMSGPGKAMETSVDVSLPSIQTDIKTSDLTIELRSAHMDVKTGELGVKIPEGHLPEGELEGRSSGVGFKGHLPKVHMPSMKMPKVDFKGPRVDIKGLKVDLKGPEGEVTVPEGEVKLGEVKGKAEGPTFKGQMPKVQMPSMKMPKVDFKSPQVDIKGPKVDLQGPKGEVTVPDMEVSLPSVEVDIQAPSAKLEGDIVLGDTEVTTKDSKFKMPKFKMPSFGMSGPGKAMETSVDVSLPSIQTDIKTSDLTIELPSAHMDVKTGELGVKIPEGHLPEGELEGRSSGVGFKGHLPKVHMPSMKMPKVEFKGPQVDIKGPKVDLKGPEGEVTVPEGEVKLGEVKGKAEGPTFKGHMPKVQMPSMKMPKVDFKGPQVDIKGPKVDLQGPKGEVTVPDMEVSLPFGEVDISAPSTKLEGDIVLGDSEVTTKDSKFKMPKFKMPSFGVSQPRKDWGTSVDVSWSHSTEQASPTSLVGEIPAPAGSIHLPSAHLAVPGGEMVVPLRDGEVTVGELKGKGEGAKFKGHLPKVQMPSIKVPKVDIKGPKMDLKCTKGEVTPPGSETAPPSVEADIQEPHAKGTGDLGLEGKEVAARESKFKMPKVSMPFFRPSSSKTYSVSADRSVCRGDVGAAPGSPAVVGVGVTLGDPGAAKAPSVQAALPGRPGVSAAGPDIGGHRAEAEALAVCEGVTLTKFQATLPGAGVAPERPPETPSESRGDAHLFSAPGAADLPSQEPVPSSQTDGRPGPADPLIRTSYGRVTFPKFHRPRFRVSEASAEAGAWEGALSPRSPARALDAEEATVSPWSATPLPLGAEEPAGGAGTPAEAAEGVPAGEAAAGAARAGSQDSWFRMPSLRLPSFWRSSPEQGGAGAPAAAPRPGVCAPGSEVETDVAGALGGGLLRPGLGSEPPLPPATTSPEEPPTAQAPPGPGEGPLSGTGPPSPRPEGPLRLKASRTDAPARVSVVGQAWEDSVLTVRFPKLKVPRFTFPAPGGEADVFVPPAAAAREVWRPDGSLALALRGEAPGAWGVSILQAGGTPGLQPPPEAPALPAEAGPISKVRVHIQGARVESREATVHTRVLTQAGPSQIQIVREAEIPASEVQTPAYGFSLLKGQVPESPLRAQVQVVTQAAERAPGAPQPDAETFEILSSGTDAGPQTTTSAGSEGSSGPQPADSGSDEEPAEILEFPPEDGREGDEAAGEKPESKRASGRFRFWLPSIGFSSGAPDAGATATTGEEPTPAPVQTQPEARPAAEPPRKQEKAGWFRFPRLGFSAAPGRKGESTGGAPAQAQPPEEAVTFFDARESLSPEDREEEPGEPATATATATATREPGGKAAAQPAPRAQ
uniref:AHNAK nucleoprotein 2 n=1 Tax=Pipistrellus kuhlii TaxID=59472 RepID=A0A7J7R1Y6_PIPKU|nr:AHNAK nucleoprotein 2 [Pipistrellus kuhlii]